jgi:predicted ATP-dependent serine protease
VFTATGRTYGGPGVPVVEIQLSTWTSPTGRGRLTTAGIPRIEIEQVAGIVFGISFAHCDRMVQGRLVGVERYQRRYGLALAVAVTAMLARQQVPSEILVLGELDLARKVRDVSMRCLENLVRSLAERELDTPITIVAPPSSADMLEGTAGIEVIAAPTWAHVVGAIWPHLRKDQ